MTVPHDREICSICGYDHEHDYPTLSWEKYNKACRDHIDHGIEKLNKQYKENPRAFAETWCIRLGLK